MPPSQREPPATPQSNGWHSWDPHPWKHPWLTVANLRRMKVLSRDFLEREKQVLSRVDPKTLRVGFCGNIANSLYVRAVPLRRAGLDVSLYLHPDDAYVMSHPGWEEYDGAAPDGELSVPALRRHGIALPEVEKVYALPQVHDWRRVYEETRGKFLRDDDARDFASYLPTMRTLIALQEMDVLWGTQAPYLAYLANRPYVVSQSGGDIWFEAARGDVLGALMRRSFAAARLNLVSNPWTFAHARRYGFANLIYLPKVLDQEIYAPGPGGLRAQWEQETGGNFFVLTSSRLDERNKGSSIGLEGFARFSRAHPEARLVLFGWGNDRERLAQKLGDLGIRDRVLALPVSGKARLRGALRSADAFMDQFVLGYFGAAGLEAMACGLPVIGRLETEQYAALCETGAPPILDAASAADVARHLGRLHADAGARRALAARTRQWFVDNHGSERWLAEHKAVLAATAVSMPADFRDSPLRERLSSRERAHHAAGMAEAPKFPHYGW